MAITKISPPKRKSARRVVVDPKIVAEAQSELAGSRDFEPYAVSDGNEYETYSEALTACNRLLNAVADANKENPRWYRRRVWEATGIEDRKKKGKWVFGLTKRSGDTLPPKTTRTRKPKDS